MKLILRVLVNALALGAADLLLDGIRAESVTSLVLTALLFGVLNALVRPLLKLLSCPLIVLTLGLFTLVLNAVMLMLTARLGRVLGIDFFVADFKTAFLGALVVSVVSIVLSWVPIDEKKG